MYSIHVSMEERLKIPTALRTRGHFDDPLELNRHLDALMAVDYSASGSGLNSCSKELTELVGGVCEVVSLKDDLLSSKCLLLISKVFGRSEVGSVASLERLVDFTVAALRKDNLWLLEEALCALKALLCASNSLDNSHIESLLGEKGVLFSFLSDTSANPNILKLTVQCIGHVYRPRESVTVREACVISAFRCLLGLLQSPPSHVTSNAYERCKLASACLKALQNIVVAHPKFIISNAATLLAALKVYAFSSHSSLISSVSLHHSLVTELSVPHSTPASGCPHGERKAHSATSPAVRAKKKRKSGRRRVKQNENAKTDSGAASDSDHLPVSSARPSDYQSDTTTKILSSQFSSLLRSQSSASSSQDYLVLHSPSVAASHPWRAMSSGSSESEVSDSELAQKQRERNAFNQVRVDGLLCLQAVVHTLDKKVVFGYWSSFIPDCLSTHGSSPHLLSLISGEGPAKVRIAALSLLMSLLDGSKQFLVAADDSEQPRSAFIPFSVTVGQMVRSLHDCLTSVVDTVLGGTLASALKCLSLLMANCPYNKLQSGYITRIIHSIIPHTNSHEAEVHIASFTCLGSVVSVCSHLDEVESLLMTQRDSGNGKTDMPAIVTLCLDQITKYHKMSEPRSAGCYGIPAVRVEAMRVLGLLFANYPVCVRHCWQIILDAVGTCLMEEVESSMKLHCVKLLNKWAAFAASQVDSVDSNDSEFLKEVLSYWNHLLSGPIAVLLDVGTPLSSPCCVATIDCLSSLGPKIFDKLPRDKHALVVTSIFQLSSASDNAVKAAAVRAVGVFVKYPCTFIDVTFLLDSCDCVVGCMSEAALAVRLKASWSLGNLTDSLLCKWSSDDKEIILPPARITSLFHCAVQGCGDNDKVRTNSLRALGNLCGFVTLPMLGPDPSLFDSGMQALDQAIKSGSVKVRWNACYAAGNLFRNSALLDGTKWAENILVSLFRAMRNSKNFKVRINAASAVHSVSDRWLYGSEALFDSIWEDLLIALDNADSVDDFSEFKYKDTLHKQLLSLVCLLTELCTDDDLSHVNRVLSPRKVALQQHFDNFLQHKLPLSSQHASVKEIGLSTEEVEDLYVRVSATVVRLRLSLSHPLQ